MLGCPEFPLHGLGALLKVLPTFLCLLISGSWTRFLKNQRFPETFIPNSECIFNFAVLVLMNVDSRVEELLEGKYQSLCVAFSGAYRCSRCQLRKCDTREELDTHIYVNWIFYITASGGRPSVRSHYTAYACYFIVDLHRDQDAEARNAEP